MADFVPDFLSVYLDIFKGVYMSICLCLCLFVSESVCMLFVLLFLPVLMLVFEYVCLSARIQSYSQLITSKYRLYHNYHIQNGLYSSIFVVVFFPEEL